MIMYNIIPPTCIHYHLSRSPTACNLLRDVWHSDSDIYSSACHISKENAILVIGTVEQSVVRNRPLNVLHHLKKLEKDKAQNS